MFVQAIIKATDFTRPVHSIARYFGATKVQPGAATIFLINDQGWALTCKHVVENMIAGNQLHAQAIEFRAKPENVKSFETPVDIV